MVTLLLGPDKIRVDTENISNIDLNFSVKDIRNYGQRNISNSKPITVLKSQKTEKVFKSLFNINTVNGYPISTKVDGELEENGVTILKGPVQVVDGDGDSYEIIIRSAEFNLFQDIGDKLIVDNDSSANDITFTTDACLHTYDRDFIRTELKSNPLNNGKSFMYPIIDFDNNLNNADNLTADYVLLPALAVREIFDGIFTKYGYTYELSADISAYINKLYIPFNDDVYKYTTNWEFAKYKIGENSILRDNRYTDEVYMIGFDTEPTPPAGEKTIDGILRGIEIATGDFDYIYDLNVGDSDPNVYGYTIPKNGIYDININLTFAKAYWFGGAGWIGVEISDMDIKLYIIRDKEKIISLSKVGTAPACADNQSGRTYFSELLSDVILEKNDMLYIGVYSPNEEFSEEGARMSVLWDSSTCLSIIEHNSFLGNENSFDLNDLRPKNYPQADFINDIFKTFNCFLEVDSNDSKKIIIKSYNYYYSNPAIKDWTEKLDQSKHRSKLLKNEFPKQIIFKYTEDDDLFNQDFISKYKYPFNYKIITNDSEFANETKEITISTAPTVFKTIETT